MPYGIRTAICTMEMQIAYVKDQIRMSSVVMSSVLNNFTQEIRKYTNIYVY